MSLLNEEKLEVGEYLSIADWINYLTQSIRR